jgi:hypothetical protein
MNQNAHLLFSTLLSLLPTTDQQASLKALVSQFLESDGNARPEHTEVKSATSLSRFLNQYHWNTRSLIREVRSQTLTLLQRRYQHQRGHRPTLYASIDPTTLEKTGEFPELPISMLNGKPGLHLVVFYLTVGEVRILWAFRVWRGRGTPSPAMLALKLLRTLPGWIKQHFRVRVLTDAGFNSSTFLESAAALKLEAVVGMRHEREAPRSDRKLETSGQLHDLTRSGQRVRLEGLGIPVWAARFVLMTESRVAKRCGLWWRPSRHLPRRSSAAAKSALQLRASSRSLSIASAWRVLVNAPPGELTVTWGCPC